MHVWRRDMEVHSFAGERLQDDDVSVADFLALGADLVAREDAPAGELDVGRRELLKGELVVSFFVARALVRVDAEERVAVDVHEAHGLAEGDLLAEAARGEVGRDVAVSAEDLEDGVLELGAVVLRGREADGVEEVVGGAEVDAGTGIFGAESDFVAVSKTARCLGHFFFF